MWSQTDEIQYYKQYVSASAQIIGYPRFSWIVVVLIRSSSLVVLKAIFFWLNEVERVLFIWERGLSLEDYYTRALKPQINFL